MITYVKLKHDILGIIWRFIWGIYAKDKHLREWMLHGDWKIAREIIVSFRIFSLLKYDRIFGKNLGHDTYGVK